MSDRHELLRRRVDAAKDAVPPPDDDERKARYDARARAGDRGRGGWGKPGGKPPKAPVTPPESFRSEEDEAKAIAAAMNEIERAERARAGRRRAAFYVHFVPWGALNPRQRAKLTWFSTLDPADHLEQAARSPARSA
jgi:hypothetical protein